MIQLDGKSLTLEQVSLVANGGESVSISKTALANIIESYQSVLRIFASSKPVYGINTGFGSFSDETISSEDSQRLNRNLILSHAVGTGDPLPVELVRAAILIRTNALVKGVSGINPKIIDILAEMLNKNVVPVIPSKGSLGSSGDLCMLAQLALVLTRDPESEEKDSYGNAFFNGERMPDDLAMESAGIQRVVLEHKDGLALINGASFSAALMALNCEIGKRLCDLADIATSLTTEALLGRADPFNAFIHKSRGMDGQIKSADNIRKMIANSHLIDSGSQVQDAYSIRCAPQVHGAVRDAVIHSSDIIIREINAATDNPLIFEDDLALSGGNFHGEPIGLVGDYFKNAMTELGAISERRIFRILDKNLNVGLPAMLVGMDAAPGLNSGLMMLQYTAAALALENQTLCSPDSVRSLPTSANQEDHNANAYLSAYHAREICLNTLKILAIELFISFRALKIRFQQSAKYILGDGSNKVFNLLEQFLPFEANDSYWKQHLEELSSRLWHENGLIKNINNILG